MIVPQLLRDLIDRGGRPLPHPPGEAKSLGALMAEIGFGSLQSPQSAAASTPWASTDTETVADVVADPASASKR